MRLRAGPQTFSHLLWHDTEWLSKNWPKASHQVPNQWKCLPSPSLEPRWWRSWSSSCSLLMTVHFWHTQRAHSGWPLQKGCSSIGSDHQPTKDRGPLLRFPHTVYSPPQITINDHPLNSVQQSTLILISNCTNPLSPFEDTKKLLLLLLFIDVISVYYYYYYFIYLIFSAVIVITCPGVKWFCMCTLVSCSLSIIMNAHI